VLSLVGLGFLPNKYIDIEEAIDLKKREEEQINSQHTMQTRDDNSSKLEWSPYGCFGQPGDLISGNLVMRNPDGENETAYSKAKDINLNDYRTFGRKQNVPALK
jgi:hypothetical protein